MGRTPPAGPRRPGLRSSEARPDARDPRHVVLRVECVRLPGARLRQQRDPRARRHAGAEGALAPPTARRGAQVGVLDDGAGDARLGPDAAAHACCARRRRVRPERAQVVHVERLDRGLPDRDGRDRPGCCAPRARLDVHRAGRCPGREHGAGRCQHGASLRALRDARRAHRDHLRGRAPRPRGPARKRRRGLPHLAAAARPWSHPPLHAVARAGAARLRHDVRAGRCTGPSAGASCATSRRCRTGSRTPRPRCRRRG